MKIVFFTEVFLPKIDGITNRLSHTIKELSKAGHDIVVFAPSGSVTHHHGAKIIPIAGFRFWLYKQVKIMWPNPTILLKMLKFKPDIVHVVGPATLGVWGTMLSKIFGLRLISSYHTDIPDYAPKYGHKWAVGPLWALIRIVHNVATLNLTPSKVTKAKLIQKGVKSVELWRGGVDRSQFKPARRCQNVRSLLTSGNSSNLSLLYVGRVSFEKNLDQLIPIVKNIPDITLSIVGDGPARKELEKAFQGYNVNFLGFKSGRELAKIFASADVFVMPSTTETLGFVTMEAMCSGLPVVAAAAGGTLDLIEDKKNGLLYQPGKSEELLAHIRLLKTDKVLRRSLARQAHLDSINFCWKLETNRLVQIYRKVIVETTSPVEVNLPSPS